MSDLNEIERGQLCQSTVESLYDATGGLRQFPRLLKKIIETKAWERRVSKGKVVELSSLRELITEKPIRGWGEDPDKVEAIIRDDAEVLPMFREAMKGKPGRPSKETPNNVRGLGSVAGNSKAYTLSRLQREAPELFEEVKAGQMSANAAAIAAGFRKKPSHAETCVKAFRKAENRLEPLRLILADLEPHEAVVAADWIKERLK